MTVGRVPRQAPADLTFSLDHDLVDSMQRLFGTSMDVKVDKIENLKEYEQPLKIVFTVGTAMNARITAGITVQRISSVVFP